MAKKPSAIYEPGELDKVRDRLGPVDESEARLIAQKLGGEIGTEKSVVNMPVKKTGYVRRGQNELLVPGRKNRRPAGISDDNYGRTQGAAKQGKDPSDDPSVQLKTSYFERIKMDRYAAQPEFEIKSPLQAFITILWFFGEPSDNLNPHFVNSRMAAYYKKIELFVNATRALLPRNNAKRSERFKKAAPYYLTILDVIRNWDIERIDAELVKVRSQTRPVTSIDFAEVVRAIYRPLFVLDKLNLDTHIRGAYKVAFKVICMEDPAEPKEKYQELIRIALTSFSDIRREVHLGLYPLLMKYISDRWFPYEQLFVDRRRRFMSFLGLTEYDQIKPLETIPGQAENGDMENVAEEEIKIEEAAEAEAEAGDQESGIDPNDPQAAAKKAREEMEKKEKKAMDNSMKVLESLFPKAGWENLEEYPDLYPYFVNTYQLRRGYELIGPSDPLLQVAVFMHIMEDICVGLRNVTFGTVIGQDGNPAQINELIGSTITNWRRFIDDSFNKEYLPRLIEYCGMIEHSPEARVTTFAKRTFNGLRWLKRLYFLPYYKFESVGPPPFQKQDVTAIYSEVRTLRRCLTQVAAGIEQGNRMGGAEVKAHCDGIENPWNKYNFEIPNPLSRRIDALLSPDKRNNTALIFFALSVITVLDNLLNNENSWAYGDKVGPIFRSVNNQGVTPLFGVDNKLDADKIFKEEMKKKEQSAKNKS